MSFALRLILLVSIVAFSGCSMFHKKSSARIIEGDGPNITYTNPESAGGRIGGR